MCIRDRIEADDGHFAPVAAGSRPVGVGHEGKHRLHGPTAGDDDAQLPREVGVEEPDLRAEPVPQPGSALAAFRDEFYVVFIADQVVRSQQEGSVLLGRGFEAMVGAEILVHERVFLFRRVHSRRPCLFLTTAACAWAFVALPSLSLIHI